MTRSGHRAAVHMGDSSLMCTSPEGHNPRHFTPLGDHRERAVLCTECRRNHTLNITARCDACMDREEGVNDVTPRS